jgi:hypothetical protein
VSRKRPKTRVQSLRSSIFSFFESVKITAKEANQIIRNRLMKIHSLGKYIP